MKCPATVQGRTLLPRILGEEEDAWDYAISGHYGNSSSIRNREWCLYYWPGADAPYTWGVGFAKLLRKTRVELYKFKPSYVPPEPHRYQPEKDQAEIKNVADREPETASFLQREMLRFLRELTPSPGDSMAKDYTKRLH